MARTPVSSKHMPSRTAAALLLAVTMGAPAAAGDPMRAVDDMQRALAARGVDLGGGVTVFTQGGAAGAAGSAYRSGGKADVLLGLDGDRLGFLWPGLSIAAHFEQSFGLDANGSGGAILPVDTALAFPTLGGRTHDLSLVVTQKFGQALSVSVGKFNMLDVIGRTPLIGGGGEATFWNIGLAAPISGVTPPYIAGATATLNTSPASFTLMVYDPRNAQDGDVVSRPFTQGVTTSLSARIPLSLFGLSGFHTFRGVYSTAEGFDFTQVPQLMLPQTGSIRLTKQGYVYGSYALQQFLWQDPTDAKRGWGFFVQVSASDANPNPIGSTIIAGLGGANPFRPDDRWGLAFCDYLFSHSLKTGLASLGGGLRDEQVLEAYYDALLVPHVRAGPDVQVIWPGTSGMSTEVFLGLRGRITY